MFGRGRASARHNGLLALLTGENLYRSSYTRTCKQAVDAWLSEQASGGGHYTQIVYPATTQVGCGLASCGMVTCSYDIIQGSKGPIVV